MELGKDLYCRLLLIFSKQQNYKYVIVSLLILKIFNDISNISDMLQP